MELAEENDGGEDRWAHDELHEADEKELVARDIGVLRQELFWREFVAHEQDEE